MLCTKDTNRNFKMQLLFLYSLDEFIPSVKARATMQNVFRYSTLSITISTAKEDLIKFLVILCQIYLLHWCLCFLPRKYYGYGLVNRTSRQIAIHLCISWLLTWIYGLKSKHTLLKWTISKYFWKLYTCLMPFCSTNTETFV